MSTVLVAEDEVLTRMFAVEVLLSLGFQVIEAEHAADALATLNARGGNISLLFTDVHMPGEMNGVELSHYVRARWPCIALLITSATADQRRPTFPLAVDFWPSPTKPLILRPTLVS